MGLQHGIGNYPRMFVRDMLDWPAFCRRPATAADEMSRLATKYTPHFDRLPDHEAERLLRISRKAVEGLQVGLVSNRKPTRAFTEALAHDAYFPSIFTSPDRSFGNNVVLLPHHVSQRTRNMYGIGDEAGSTLFATIKFTRPAPEAGLLEALAGHRGVNRSTFGGAVAMDLLPVGPGGIDAARVSVTARDSTFAFALPAPWSRLGDAVAERVARDYGFVRDFVKVGPKQYRAAAHAEPVAVRNERLLGLLHGPEDEAVEAVRAHITSPRMGELNQYMEAQVRGGRGSDVARLRLVDDVTPEEVARIQWATRVRGIDLLDQREAGAALIAAGAPW